MAYYRYFLDIPTDHFKKMNHPAANYVFKVNSRNMFKVNNKDTRTTPSYFTPCSLVSTVNFEQVNANICNWYFWDLKVN